MNQVEVRFFAAFRDAARCESLSVQTAAVDARALFDELCGRFEDLHHEAAALVAINDEMADWHSPLGNGDRILYFPPVAGG